MPVTAVSLQPGITLTSSQQTVATGSGSSTIVTQAIVTNATSASINLTVQIQRAGGSTMTLIPARSVAASSASIPGELAGFILNDGDTILASGAGLTLIANGYVQS